MTIQELARDVMSRLRETRARPMVAYQLWARDFKYKRGSRGVPANATLTGQMERLKKFLEKQGLKCSVRRIKPRFYPGLGVCGVPPHWIYGLLMVSGKVTKNSE